MLVNMPEILFIVSQFDDAFGFFFNRNKKWYGYISVSWALRLR